MPSVGKQSDLAINTHLFHYCYRSYRQFVLIHFEPVKSGSTFINQGGAAGEMRTALCGAAVRAGSERRTIPLYTKMPRREKLRAACAPHQMPFFLDSIHDEMNMEVRKG